MQRLAWCRQPRQAAQFLPEIVERPQPAHPPAETFHDALPVSMLIPPGQDADDDTVALRDHESLYIHPAQSSVNRQEIVALILRKELPPWPLRRQEFQHRRQSIDSARSKSQSLWDRGSRRLSWQRDGN